MLDQVLEFFDIRTDYDLDLMRPDQTLFDITARGLKGLEAVLDDFNPDLALVHGDTTTAFVGALAASYRKISVAHVEAGLRRYNKHSPFPEEINRKLAGHLADYHFAPTLKAKRCLENEGIKENVRVVGNTVIDALYLALEIIRKTGERNYREHFDYLDFSRKLILITGHRRESFGQPFENICNALQELSGKFPDLEMVYPVHLNPHVREPVNRILKNNPRIHLVEPLEYPYLVWLMNKSYFVLTDSGGIQEEAPSLGKPVLVMREVTERTEGIDGGTARLVGTDRDVIVAEASKLLNDDNEYLKMSRAVNPYGDGDTSAKIVQIILKEYAGKP